MKEDTIQEKYKYNRTVFYNNRERIKVLFKNYGTKCNRRKCSFTHYSVNFNLHKAMVQNNNISFGTFYITF